MDAKELKLKFTAETGEATAGIDKVTQATDKLKVSANELGGKQDSALGRMRDNLSKFSNKDAPDAEKSLAGFNLEGRQTRKIAAELSEIFPELGEVLMAAVDPEATGIFILIAALGFVIRYLKEGKQEAKETKEALEELSHAAPDALADSMEAAAESARDFEETLQRIPDLIEIIKQSENEHLKILDAEAAAAEAILAAEEQLALARAAGNPAEQARIRDSFGEKRDRASLDRERAAIQEERNEMGKLPDPEELAIKMGQAFAEKNRAQQAEANQSPQLEEDIKFLKDKVAYYQNRLDTTPSSDPAAVQAAVDLQGATNALTKSEGELNDLKTATKDATDAYNKSVKSVTDVNKEGDEFARNIREASQILAIHKSTFEQTQPLKDLASLITQYRDLGPALQNAGGNIQWYVQEFSRVTIQGHMTAAQQIKELSRDIQIIYGKLKISPNTVPPQ